MVGDIVTGQVRKDNPRGVHTGLHRCWPVRESRHHGYFR